MNVTDELNDHLLDEDPAELLDLLNITSFDLVQRFGDRIEDKFEELKGLILHDELDISDEDD